MKISKVLFSVCLILASLSLFGQDNKSENMPYHSIPEYPEDFSSGNIISRMIDGLGYRYYWASEGLRAEDLSYKPSEEGRTTRETLEHILGLSRTVLNASKNEVNSGRIDYAAMNYEEIRNMTLENLSEASRLMLGKKDKDVSNLKVKFKRGEKITEYPYWNMINGPIEDAIWHSGQVVSFRRASGNPLNPGVSVFSGKTRE